MDWLASFDPAAASSSSSSSRTQQHRGQPTADAHQRTATASTSSPAASSSSRQGAYPSRPQYVPPTRSAGRAYNPRPPPRTSLRTRAAPPAAALRQEDTQPNENQLRAKPWESHTPPSIGASKAKRKLPERATPAQSQAPSSSKPSEQRPSNKRPPSHHNQQSYRPPKSQRKAMKQQSYHANHQQPRKHRDDYPPAPSASKCIDAPHSQPSRTKPSPISIDDVSPEIRLWSSQARAQAEKRVAIANMSARPSDSIDSIREQLEPTKHNEHEEAWRRSQHQLAHPRSHSIMLCLALSNQPHRLLRLLHVRVELYHCVASLLDPETRERRREAALVKLLRSALLALLKLDHADVDTTTFCSTEQMLRPDDPVIIDTEDQIRDTDDVGLYALAALTNMLATFGPRILDVEWDDVDRWKHKHKIKVKTTPRAVVMSGHYGKDEVAQPTRKDTKAKASAAAREERKEDQPVHQLPKVDARSGIAEDSVTGPAAVESEAPQKSHTLGQPQSADALVECTDSGANTEIDPAARRGIRTPTPKLPPCRQVDSQPAAIHESRESQVIEAAEPDADVRASVEASGTTPEISQSRQVDLSTEGIDDRADNHAVEATEPDPYTLGSRDMIRTPSPPPPPPSQQRQPADSARAAIEPAPAAGSALHPRPHSSPNKLGKLKGLRSIVAHTPCVEPNRALEAELSGQDEATLEEARQAQELAQFLEGRHSSDDEDDDDDRPLAQLSQPIRRDNTARQTAGNESDPDEDVPLQDLLRRHSPPVTSTATRPATEGARATSATKPFQSDVWGVDQARAFSSTRGLAIKYLVPLASPSLEARPGVRTRATMFDAAIGVTDHGRIATFSEEPYSSGRRDGEGAPDWVMQLRTRDADAKLKSDKVGPIDRVEDASRLTSKVCGIASSTRRLLGMGPYDEYPCQVSMVMLDEGRGHRTYHLDERPHAQGATSMSHFPRTDPDDAASIDFATGGLDGIVTHWHWRARSTAARTQRLHTLHDAKPVVALEHVSSRANVLASASIGTVIGFDLAALTLGFSWTTSDRIVHLQRTPDPKLMLGVLARRDYDQFRMFDITGGNGPISRPVISFGWLNDAEGKLPLGRGAFHPSRRAIFAHAAEDGHVRVWDLRNARDPLLDLRVSDEPIVQAVWANSGQEESADRLYAATPRGVRSIAWCQA